MVDLQCFVYFWYTVKWLSYTSKYILFSLDILFRYGLLQYTEYSYPYSTKGPCCLSIRYTLVCIC